MDIERIAAFTLEGEGGNPAGVVISDRLPETAEMQRIAGEVGYSETAFAAPDGENWRVRYFSPESEVPFCGHATIALGAALAGKEGSGTFTLNLNEATITVDGTSQDGVISAALQSPPTSSQPLSEAEVQATLDLFGYSTDMLDMRIPPALVNGGANHSVLALKERAQLAAMNYDLDAGRIFMNERGLITICLVWVEANQVFHTRNAFASGGVLEDPATGAATAAFSGYLRDLNWAHGGKITLFQGEDMGRASRIVSEIPDTPGASICVSGQAQHIANG